MNFEGKFDVLAMFVKTSLTNQWMLGKGFYNHKMI
jgi:hypothetical protein